MCNFPSGDYICTQLYRHLQYDRNGLFKNLIRSKVCWSKYKNNWIEFLNSGKTLKDSLIYLFYVSYYKRIMQTWFRSGSWTSTVSSMMITWLTFAFLLVLLSWILKESSDWSLEAALHVEILHIVAAVSCSLPGLHAVTHHAPAADWQLQHWGLCCLTECNLSLLPLFCINRCIVSFWDYSNIFLFLCLRGVDGKIPTDPKSHHAQCVEMRDDTWAVDPLVFLYPLVSRQMTSWRKWVIVQTDKAAGTCWPQSGAPKSGPLTQCSISACLNDTHKALSSYLQWPLLSIHAIHANNATSSRTLGLWLTVGVGALVSDFSLYLTLNCLSSPDTPSKTQ